MDQSIHERCLALPERRITQLEHHTERQRRVVAGLEAAGRGKTETAEIARDVLEPMERNLNWAIAERKLIRAQLRRSRSA